MVLHDNFALTLQALASLRANYPGDIQVVLIDSGSTDETRHLSRYVRGADLLRFEANISFVRGCNAALEFVTADILRRYYGIDCDPSSSFCLGADSRAAIGNSW